jgi:hypothetical protein
MATPILDFNDVPLVAMMLDGASGGWRWEPLSPVAASEAGKISSTRLGAIYFGERDGRIKIGFSDDPLKRVLVQHIEPILFIAACQPKHERATHALFASERISGEWFAGARIDRFAKLARMRTVCTPREWRGDPFRSRWLEGGERTVEHMRILDAGSAFFERREGLVDLFFPPGDHYEVHIKPEAAE